MNLGMVNCMRCHFRNEANGNCTAVGGFCTAVPAAHCPLLHNYLDVGLMPDQVANAKVIIESAFAEDTSKAERIRALLKADAEGRVVVLPCRVGDTLYQLSSAYTECTVYGVRKDNYCCEGCEVPCDSHEVIFIDTIRPSSLVATIRCCEELGKTVFLTHGEAEKALEAMKDD